MKPKKAEFDIEILIWRLRFLHRKDMYVILCSIDIRHYDVHVYRLGMVELCAKNLQIMRNDFTDYARTFCQLCANYARA